MKTKYVLYARKSSEGEDRQINSIDDQLNVLKEIIHKNSYQVIQSFSESRSAKAPGRVEFNRMIQTIYKRDDIKGIICWHLNRLTRNPIDCATLQWMLQNRVIEEIVTPDKTYREEDSDYIMAFEGAGATKFIKDLRKGTLRGLQAKIDRGIAPILAPVGYINSKFNSQGMNDITPHPVYFDCVKNLLKYALSGKHSGEELFQMALNMGIKTNRGDQLLSRTRLYELLREPFYAGKFRYKGELHDGIHQTMISWAEFELLQEVMSGRSITHKNTHNMLNGLLRCKVCGHMLTGEEKYKHQKNGNINHFAYYRCNGARKHLCNQKPVNAKNLEAQMKNYLDQLHIDPEYIEWSIKQIRKNNELETLHRQILDQHTARELKDNKLKLDNLYKLKLSPLNHDGSLLTDEEFKEQKNLLTIERQQIEDREKCLTKRQFDWIDLCEKTYRFCEIAAENFRTGTIEEKKYLMRVFGSDLLIKDGILEIEPRGPFKIIYNGLKAQSEALGPLKMIDDRINTGAFHLQNTVWGG